MSDVGLLQLLSLIFSIATFFLGMYLGRKDKNTEPKETPAPAPPIYLNAPNDPRIDDLIDVIHAMPQKVLESITSSANQQKGRLGELIGYLNLNSKYDRLIALRDITDFLAIRFPKDGQEGSVDFIDVKNGPNARLTKDQTILKGLIKDGKVRFYSFKIETSSGNDTGPED